MTDTSDSAAHTVRVEGELDVDNVPARLRKSAGWFERGRDTVIDLGGVTRADSAGVALLLEWIRDADKAGATLHFANAPSQMRAIIDFCALGDVIPLDRAN
ncbi:STAS domain-containing protein [Salinisphaera sp.]|uniref:STAS domain-containing protein n=1 Tax=Salinisphaera sp. TaxID=1914330 RepID=UPI002D7A0009|nr:STAS domain-containing protein [Salinisphaera sp.]HET7314261.1 STAS domain-containing protein [Salinisphaera sp.]